METDKAVGGPQAKFAPELVEEVQPVRLQVSKSPLTQAWEDAKGTSQRRTATTTASNAKRFGDPDKGPSLFFILGNMIPGPGRFHSTFTLGMLPLVAMEFRKEGVKKG